VYCIACGHRNRDDAHFCSKCGSLLQEDTTIRFSPIDAEDEALEIAGLAHGELEPGQALLMMQRGPNAGSRFFVDQDVTTIGRHPESDIFLDDVTVSRKHAEVRREGGTFYVHDVGSLNGTYVNQTRVDDTELASGDEVQVGKFKLSFFVGE
jgi:pSer/pThr/pTyr-binding forkhead associated (FHA) protein